MADLRLQRALDTDVPAPRRSRRPRHPGEVNPAVTMTTVERVVALQRVPLFAEVPGRTLAAVAQRATEVEVEAGGLVIEQGAVEDHLFAVVTGRLVARDGERVLRELAAGSTVGELAALAPEPRSAGVTALVPTLAAADRQARARRAAGRPPRARARRHHLARADDPEQRALVSGEPLPSGHGAVRWLVAQSVAFGIVAALLGVVANTMFLEAYGAQWLPLTYVVIGAAGAAVSAAVARSARRFDLVRIAVVVLGATAVLLLGAWVATLGGGGAWVSGPLLVLFPVLIQLGFVFIGAQAGRILDIAGIKARFPRIIAGFPVGAVVGGLLAAPLVDLLGSTEGLLLATALAQAVFTALVVVTGIRYAAFLAIDPGPPPARDGRERSGRVGRRPRAPPPAGDPVRGAHPRVPGALGAGLAALRLPRVRPRGGAVPGRRRPRAVPRGLHRRDERGQHRVPRPRGGTADAPVRPAPRDLGQPGRPARGERRHARRARRLRRCVGGPAGGGLGRPHPRHRAHRRDDPHVDQRDVPGAARAPAAPGAGHDRGNRRARGDQRLRPARARPQRAAVAPHRHRRDDRPRLCGVGVDRSAAPPCVRTRSRRRLA